MLAKPNAVLQGASHTRDTKLQTLPKSLPHDVFVSSLLIPFNYSNNLYEKQKQVRKEKVKGAAE